MNIDSKLIEDGIGYRKYTVNAGSKEYTVEFFKRQAGWAWACGGGTFPISLYQWANDLAFHFTLEATV